MEFYNRVIAFDDFKILAVFKNKMRCIKIFFILQGHTKHINNQFLVPCFGVMYIFPFIDWVGYVYDSLYILLVYYLILIYY